MFWFWGNKGGTIQVCFTYNHIMIFRMVSMSAFYVLVVLPHVPAIGGMLTNIWALLCWCKLTGGWSIQEIRAPKKGLINLEIHSLSTDVTQSWTAPRPVLRYVYIYTKMKTGIKRFISCNVLLSRDSFRHSLEEVSDKGKIILYVD